MCRLTEETEWVAQAQIKDLTQDQLVVMGKIGITLDQEEGLVL